MEPWMTVDAHNVCVEVQNGTLRGRPVAADSHHFNDKHHTDSDPH